MRELISAIVIAISLAGGTAAIKSLHNQIRQAALEKAAKGLPSLSQMTRAIQKKKEEFRKTEQE